MEDEFKIADMGIKKVSLDKIKNHKHIGTDADRISPRDLRLSFYEVVTAVPTARPKNFMEQIKIYNQGGNVYLYVWDDTNEAWHKFNFYLP